MHAAMLAASRDEPIVCRLRSPSWLTTTSPGSHATVLPSRRVTSWTTAPSRARTCGTRKRCRPMRSGTPSSWGAVTMLSARWTCCFRNVIPTCRPVATFKERYRSYVDRLGPAIVMNGLGQALATEPQPPGHRRGRMTRRRTMNCTSGRGTGCAGRTAICLSAGHRPLAGNHEPRRGVLLARPPRLWRGWSGTRSPVVPSFPRAREMRREPAALQNGP